MKFRQMLLIGVFTLLLAIALYSRNITPTLLNRITIIILIYSSLLSYNIHYPTELSEELGIYGNLYLVTSITQSFDLFIYIIGATLLFLNEYPLTLNHHTPPYNERAASVARPTVHLSPFLSL